MKTKTLLLIAAITAASLAVAGAVMPSMKSVTVRGSDTMLIINQRWAEAFHNANPGSDVAVTGGGSSIGINSFINGVADIAAASRPMRKSEIDRARSRGSIAFETPVALDGLCVAINSSNSISSLSMDQLRRIYIGQVTNWNQVGGPNAPITTLSRDSNSGTYGFFQTNVLRNQNWGKGVRFLPSTSEEVREVQRNRNAIAYGGVAYFRNKKDVKIIPISPRDGVAAIAPTEENVRSKKYPIWRYLYFYTNGRPTGSTKRFVDFVLSPAGQKIVEEVGYFSLR